MKFRLWVNYCQGDGNYNGNYYIPVDTLLQVMVAFQMLATAGQEFDEMCNASGLEVFNEEENDWEEFYDNDGNLIDDYYNSIDFSEYQEVLQHDVSLENLMKEVPSFWEMKLAEL